MQTAAVQGKTSSFIMQIMPVEIPGFLECKNTNNQSQVSCDVFFQRLAK